MVYDVSRRCRVLTGYYDGRLHLGLTRILDFSEYDLVPPAGIPYLENIDQEKIYRMVNMLLKWAWPIAPITKNQDGDIPPVIVHHPRDEFPVDRLLDDHLEMPEMEEIDWVDDDWVKVEA